MLKRILSFFKPVAGSQRDNRLKLADHLEKNVTDDNYYQQYFAAGARGCALGHAARIGMGGFGFDENESITINGARPESAAHFIETVENTFGKGTQQTIFGCNPENLLHDSTRKSVITALRSYS